MSRKESAAASPPMAVEAAEIGALGTAGVKKLYMPTALLKEHLPVGMDKVQRVPSMRDSSKASYAERVDEYVEAIRETARVFEVSNHKSTTLAEYDKYMCWIDGWAQLSGFEALVRVDRQVRAA